MDVRGRRRQRSDRFQAFQFPGASHVDGGAVLDEAAFHFIWQEAGGVEGEPGPPPP